MSIRECSLIDKHKQVFFYEKGLSIREKSLIDKMGLPKKVWQYCSSIEVEITILVYGGDAASRLADACPAAA